MSQSQPPPIDYAQNTRAPASPAARASARNVAILLGLCDLCRIVIVVYLAKTHDNAYDFALGAAMLLGGSSIVTCLFSLVGAVISERGRLSRYKQIFALHAFVDFWVFIALELGGKQLWQFLDAL